MVCSLYLFRYDYVEIYDGKDTSAPKMGSYCSNKVSVVVLVVLNQTTDKLLLCTLFFTYTQLNIIIVSVDYTASIVPFALYTTLIWKV